MNWAGVLMMRETPAISPPPRMSMGLATVTMERMPRVSGKPAWMSVSSPPMHQPISDSSRAPLCARTAASASPIMRSA